MGVTSWIIIAVAALYRVAYLWRPTRMWFGADEGTYWRMATIVGQRGLAGLRELNEQFCTADPAHQQISPPYRVGYLWPLALLLRLSRGNPRVMCWLATASGVATVGMAAGLAWWIGGEPAAMGAAVLVGSSPLLLGAGRRPWLDVPAVATQLAIVVVALPGPAWWPVVAAATVLALLLRESSRSVLPGVGLAVLWLWGWRWREVALAADVAFVSYSVALWWTCGVWPWQLPSAFLNRVLRPPQRVLYSFAHNACRGGLRRLLDDIGKLSPGIVAAVLVAGGWRHPLAWGAVLVLVSYSVPWLDQQIRPCLVSDVLLRIVAGLTVTEWPWLLALVLVDAHTFYRIWWVGRCRDPSNVTLGRLLGHHAATPMGLPPEDG